MKSKKKSYITVLILVIFISFGLFIKISGNNTNNIDYNILAFIRNNIYPGKFFKIITTIGNVKSYFLILIPLTIILLYKKEYKILTILLFSVLFSALFMSLFKNIFQRIRPEEFFVIEEGGYSYPSGHSTVGGVFYFTIYQLLNYWKKNRIVSMFFIILPILIGFSRLVLGVHWPSDVAIGLLIGLCISWISIEIYSRLKVRSNG